MGGVTGGQTGEVFAEVIPISPGRFSEEVRFKKRSGLPTSFKVNRVCRACNHGWMRRLEELTEPIVLSLINGETCNIDESSQLILARWLMMTVMVVEFANPISPPGISQEQRVQFYQDKTPFPSARIWIAPQEGKQWRARFWHDSFNFSYVEENSSGPVAARVPPPPNTQSTTIGIGKLLVTCFSTDIPEYVDSFRVDGAHLLWPIQGGIDWPGGRAWTDSEAEALARGVFYYLNRSGSTLIR